MIGIGNWSVPAGADLTGKLFFCATLDSSGNIIVQTTANAAVAGVITEEGSNLTGLPASIQTDGIAKVIAGATITPGQQVAVNASGQVVPFATGVAVGLALNGGVSGNIISIKIF
jgi:hypothetical protein